MRVEICWPFLMLRQQQQFKALMETDLWNSVLVFGLPPHLSPPADDFEARGRGQPQEDNQLGLEVHVGHRHPCEEVRRIQT